MLLFSFVPFPSSHEYNTRKERQETMELMKQIEGGAIRMVKQPEPHFADEYVMRIGKKVLEGVSDEELWKEEPRHSEGWVPATGQQYGQNQRCGRDKRGEWSHPRRY
jgi:hypothetical protein